MRVFVTGASGFVGGHAVERFVSAGHAVRAMARSDRGAAAVEALGATAVRCDLEDVAPPHLEGCDAVVHCAARAEEWGTREEFTRANVDGTQRMLDAARGAGVPRFVHVGTEAALFAGRDLIDVDERAPYPARHRYLYAETKAEAERRLLAANAPGFTTISVRPRFVWGPRDRSVLPAILEMARKGSFAWIDGGARLTSTTHVRNAVHGLELALTRGRGGEAYFVADDGTRTVREFLTRLVEAAAGVTLPSKNVPSRVARPAAFVVEGAWRLLGIRRAPPMTRFAVEMMSSTVTVRTDKARAELGYAPVITVDEGLEALRRERAKAPA